MKNKMRLRKLSRNTAHRDSLFRNMVTSLIQHERIRTTLAKAKEIKRQADSVIAWAKEGKAQHHTLAFGYLNSPEVVTKLFQVLGPRYKNRNGGYTRVLRTGYRRGDRAPMAIIEYVDRPGELRPARPPILSSPINASSSSSSSTASTEKHQNLNDKVKEILAKQEEARALIKAGTIPSNVNPGFPKPATTIVSWQQFETIKSLQTEYAQKQKEIKRNALLNKTKQDNINTKGTSKDSTVLQ